MSDRVRLGIVRGISYGVFAPPDEFMPAARELGASLVRLYVYWAQVEPRPGEYDWRVVDAVLAQLADGDELWLTVCSSSPWATKVPTDFLPPSAALDDDAYSAFVRALVARFGGRVRFWQCNNEPSNAGLLWAGTAEEYVHQARLFAAAVRATDSSAQVVLGGCGYDALSSPKDGPAWTFFDTVVRDAADAFDLFAVHLYDDPYRIPGHLEAVRELMRSHGCERPVVAGEYNGPTLFEFPAATAALQQTMAAAFTTPDPATAVEMSTADLTAQATEETPDRRAVRQLYARSDTLPRELRMFMQDAPPELAALRDRVACRQLVQRALLLLASGVDTLTCWNLAPEIGGYRDPYNVMDLMFGTLALMDYEDGRITRVRPEGRSHRLLATVAGDAVRVERLPLAEVYAFRIEAIDGTTRLACWVRGDDPLDETATLSVRLAWPHSGAHAIDVFGAEIPLQQDNGEIRLEATTTPVFITPQRASLPE